MEWHSSEYWEKAWQAESQASTYGKRQTGIDRVDWWNKRAPGFASKKHEEGTSSSQHTILGILDRSGFLSPDAEVLDIGCGPGHYALPSAAKVKKVTALDASPVMLSILRERAEAMGISNIETVCLPWEDADLDTLGWRGKFNLVAAIKSPGIRDAESLQKMTAASKKGVFYNGFVRREDNAQNDIWRICFKENKPPVPADVFHVFHLLHAMGYLPKLELSQYISGKTSPVGEAADELMLLMKPYEDLSGTMDEEIRRYVTNNSNDNQLMRIRYTVEGNILFSVTERQQH